MVAFEVNVDVTEPALLDKETSCTTVKDSVNEQDAALVLAVSIVSEFAIAYFRFTVVLVVKPFKATL